MGASTWHRPSLCSRLPPAEHATATGEIETIIGT
jgi:hypothetical protein